jgi:UDP-glucose 4-epimerase
MDMNGARRVLVTGADGFIGRALVTSLAAQGIDHVAAVRVRRPDSAPSALALGDFAAADWTGAMRSVGTIVHLAGRAHVLRGDHDPTPHIVANVHVTRRLIDAARHAGVRRVVFASTIKVYGENTRPGHPFTAGDPARPRDAYAKSKAEAEQVIVRACAAGGMDAVVLRLPLVYGPGVKGNFALLLDAIANGRRLPFAGVSNRRSLLFVGNAVSAIERAMVAAALGGQVLPVADREAVSTPQLIRALALAMHVEPRLSRLPTSMLRAGAALMGRRGASQRLLDSLEVDGRRFESLAGWAPPFSFSEGIATTAAWWRARGDVSASPRREAPAPL